MSPCFLTMTEITEKVHTLLEPLLEGTDMFVVNIKVKPVNNVKVYLDADGGLSIDKSATVNRKLYALLEESQMFTDGDFSLEVSSPGVDEPLTQKRQYLKNKGRTVLVTLADGAEKTGVLKEVGDEVITLEMKGTKQKPVVTTAEIPFTDIKKTVVQINFN